MNRKFVVLLSVGVFALALVIGNFTLNTSAQSDRAFERANENASFLQCGTKHPDEANSPLN